MGNSGARPLRQKPARQRLGYLRRQQEELFYERRFSSTRSWCGRAAIQCVSNTVWYCARLAIVAVNSVSVGWPASSAIGRLPNFIRHAMSSSRALEAVRVLPDRKDGACGVKPSSRVEALRVWAD